MFQKMYPRLQLDIGWLDMLSVFVPLTTSKDQILATALSAWPKNSLFCLSVRTGFDALFRVLNLPAGTVIAMSGINIANMVQIVQAHGLRVVSVDLDYATLTPRLVDLQASFEQHKPHVYVHAHLFGARSNVSKIAALCKVHGVLFIEDCAQAWTHDAPCIIPEADLAFYSFGPIKAHTSLAGSVLVCKDQTLSRRLDATLKALPQKSETWFLWRTLKMMALKLLSGPRIYWLLIAVLTALGKDVDRIVGGAARGFSGDDILSAVRFAPPLKLIRLAARRFTEVKPPANWRTEAAAILNYALEGKPIQLGIAAETHGYWLYPVVSGDPERLIKKLRAAGYDASRGATSLRAISPTNPNANFMLNQVVYLPFSRAMSPEALRHLANLVVSDALVPER
jgi:perosamine synthetase